MSSTSSTLVTVDRFKLTLPVGLKPLLINWIPGFENLNGGGVEL